MQQQTQSLDRYLGAARVVRDAGDTLLVALKEAADHPLVHAAPALAFPYRPVIGDQLLVIGDAHAFYVIGVLAGRGRSRLKSSRGMSLEAKGGRLRLRGDRGVKISGPNVRVQTQRFKKLALATLQTFGHLASRVRENVNVEAGEIDALSQNRWLLQGRRVVLKALKGARVNSTTVRLG